MRLVVAATAAFTLAASYDWPGAVSRMYAVMEASVEKYRSELNATELLTALVREPKRTVWVVDGELYVDAQFVQDKIKGNLHLRFMKSILSRNASRGRRRPRRRHIEQELEALRASKSRTAYTFHQSSSGMEHCANESKYVPTFVIAKKKPEVPCGVMLPNPYFGDLEDWGDEMARLKKIADARSWEKRKGQVFWRGKIRGDGETNPKHCSNSAGNYARISACALSLVHPRLFDVRTNSCRPQAPEMCESFFHYSDSEKRALRDFFAWRNTSTAPVPPREYCEPILGDFLQHDDFSKYRFLLDLPGSTTGSYSRNLNHLWLFGSVVCLWDGPQLAPHGGAHQWYSPALLENVTHAVLSRETAAATIAKIAKSPDERKRLVDHARAVSEHLLCPDCIADYVLAALAKLRDLLRSRDARGGPSFLTLLNDRSDERVVALRASVLRDAGCDDLDLQRIVSSPPKRVSSSGGKKTSWRSAVRAIPINASACDFLSFSSSRRKNLLTSSSHRRR